MSKQHSAKRISLHLYSLSSIESYPKNLESTHFVEYKSITTNNVNTKKTQLSF